MTPKRLGDLMMRRFRDNGLMAECLNEIVKLRDFAALAIFECDNDLNRGKLQGFDNNGARAQRLKRLRASARELLAGE